MKKLIYPLLLILAMTTAKSAEAARQPMALGAQRFTLAANGTHEAIAFCFDHSLTIPDRNTDLRNVSGGAANVCKGSNTCLPLQDAIERGWVRIHGTGHYGIVFENLTRENLRVDVGDSTVLSDEPVKAGKLPSIKLPTKQHDGVAQFRAWYELGQVDALREVIIVEVEGGYTIIGRDGIHASPAAVIKDVKEADLGRTLVRLAYRADVAFLIKARLDADKISGLFEDVRLQAAKKGLVVMLNVNRAGLEDFSAASDVVIAPKPVEFATPNERRVEATMELTSDRDPSIVIPARAIVQFKRPEPLTVRTRVGQLMRGVMNRLRGKDAAPLLETATDVRDAVKEEIRALRTTLSRGNGLSEDAVWVIVGNAARGYILVRIPLVETPWAV